MNRTMKTFYEKESFFSNWRLPIDDKAAIGLIKCRVVYDENGVNEITYELYKPRHYSKLFFAQDDNLTYSYKYEDRTCLHLRDKILGRNEAIIFLKHGMLTDSTYYNIALQENGIWYTPKHPLLKGVKRAQLIDDGLLKERVILKEDMHLFQRISFINALNDLGEVGFDLKFNQRTLFDDIL
jgi:4-amino-4-deoxychorismate lyase